jgi:hypothetical protein
VLHYFRGGRAEAQTFILGIWFWVADEMEWDVIGRFRVFGSLGDLVKLRSEMLEGTLRRSFGAQPSRERDI